MIITTPKSFSHYMREAPTDKQEIKSYLKELYHNLRDYVYIGDDTTRETRKKAMQTLKQINKYLMKKYDLDFASVFEKKDIEYGEFYF